MSNFETHMESSKTLLKMMFGEEVYNKLENTKLKSLEYTGIDITASSILCGFPNIKERLNPKWTEYFSERDYSQLDLFLQIVYHFGYQSCYDHEVRPEKEYTKIMSELFHELKINEKINTLIKDI